MPEYAKLYASYWLANHFICSVQPVIIIDATDLEQAHSSSNSLACNGFPYPLAQEDNIYPSISCNIPDTHLKLEDPILCFTSSSENASIAGEWWMQVQMLTHTIIQVYVMLDFHEWICKVSKKSCGFHIAMALDLEFIDWLQSLLTTYLLALECIQLQRYFTMQVFYPPSSSPSLMWRSLTACLDVLASWKHFSLMQVKLVQKWAWLAQEYLNRKSDRIAWLT
ncbi:hypothetical protein BDN71DRAFT_1437013 [Pleurotus eryngii]|uniref:Uncharacterized protein n=1 Tax=Pleurotus eryngii TaxID=5323 RepID=A0A9P5ZHF4_PLEER|nr:hypothetical protein BDN71DRAFT_1437013 [Pleurotus eryngii]